LTLILRKRSDIKERAEKSVDDMACLVKSYRNARSSKSSIGLWSAFLGEAIRRKGEKEFNSQKYKVKTRLRKV